jgi:AraC-like DNA-binding protein
VGVQFRPGGAAAFFGGDTAALQNQTVLLDTFWGAFARELHERLQAVKEVGARLRLLESLLTSRLDSARAPDRRVDAALTVLHRDPTATRVGPAQDASGLGTTRFIQRFHAEVGLTPKRYARVLRLTTLLRLIPAEGARDLAGLAAEVGYADQAHLAHDFRALTGLTLSEYRAAAPDRPTHVARSEVFDKTLRDGSGKVVT